MVELQGICVASLDQAGGFRDVLSNDIHQLKSSSAAVHILTACLQTTTMTAIVSMRLDQHRLDQAPVCSLCSPSTSTDLRFKFVCINDSTCDPKLTSASHT